MDETETSSSSYFEPLFGALCCRNSTFLDCQPSHFTISPQEKAILQFLIQLEEACKQQYTQPDQTKQKRTLPPVPKFDDFEPSVDKRVKKPTSNTETVKQTVSFTPCTKSGTKETPTTIQPDRCSTQSQCKTDIEEEKSDTTFMRDKNVSSLSQSIKTIPLEERKQYSFGNCPNVDSLICQSVEDVTEKPSAKFSDRKTTKPSASACSDSEIPLDKKDLKKFKKFESCFREYLQKLNITDSSVEKKYLEILRLVVPQLSTQFKSKPFEAIAAAVLLYACREVQYPITIKQITQVTDAKEKLINKCIYAIKEILPNVQEIKFFSADEFIVVIGDKLLINDVIKQAALKIHDNIVKLGYVKSSHAATLASCCIKFASALSGEDRGFDEIAEGAGINKLTLRNMYRDLFPYRFYFITSDCHLLKSPAELPDL